MKGPGKLSESSWIFRQNCCKLTAVSVFYFLGYLIWWHGLKRIHSTKETFQLDYSFENCKLLYDSMIVNTNTNITINQYSKINFLLSPFPKYLIFFVLSIYFLAEMRNWVMNNKYLTNNNSSYYYLAYLKSEIMQIILIIICLKIILPG